MNMLRKLTLCCAVAACPWVPQLAHAADCKVTLNDDTVNVGHLYGTRGGESTTGTRYPISSASRTLSVICPSSTTIAIKMDGIPHTTDGSISLGGAADYTLTVTDMTLDGKSIKIGKSVSGKPIELVTSPTLIQPSDMITPMEFVAPTAGTRLDISLRVDVYRARQTALSNETTLTSESRFLLVTP